MSWADRYKQQAAAWRQDAHNWAMAGKEAHAQRCLDNAAAYDFLAEEEEGRPLSVTREEAQKLIAEDNDG